jgi:hypothetical protein
MNEMGQVCDWESSGEKNAYRLLVPKPKGKRKLGKLTRTWEVWT